MQGENSERILVITHDATRTGAPLLLLQLLRWLSANTSFACDVLFRRRGPIAAEFEAAAGVCLDWTPSSARPRLPAQIWRSLRHRIGVPVPSYRERLIDRITHRRYALIYGNTAAVCDVLCPLLQRTGVPAILHVHELESALRHAAAGPDLAWALSVVARVVSVSEPVTRNLTGRHGVPISRILGVPEFVPELPRAKASAEMIRRELHIPASAIVVGGSGTLRFRKGPDLFLQVARRVVRLLPDKSINFVWVGDDDGAIRFLLEEDARKTGLEGRFRFTGVVGNPTDYFRSFDMFLMTSREDPFPLVCLENAHCGNPIVCFADAIGSTEFIDESCGHVSPYLDLDDMAHAVAEFAADPDRRRRAGEEIRRRAAAYTTERVAPRIAACIREVIDARKASQ